MNRHLIYYISLLSMLIVAGCANRGVGPQGGPKDETPPKLLKETPVNGTVNFHDKVITLQYDEYLQMNDVAGQVLISPPQQRPPIVKAVGKKVVVSFEQDMRDSTTYTIDFGNSICDLNEKNPVEGYVFSFSTGPEIDTLQISGTLINSEDLNPMAGIYVGIHEDLNDSALSTKAFTRIARTNEKGEFRILNVHPGTYRLYALNDVSKDYMYQPGEGLAFLDTVFVPIAIDSLVLPEVKKDSLPQDSLVTDSLALMTDPDFVPINDSTVLFVPHNSEVTDSVPADTLVTDSVAKPRMVTRYEPSGIVLRYFEENKTRHYYIRYLREERHFIKLLFSAEQDTLPLVKILNAPIVWGDTARMDSVAAAQADSLAAMADSLNTTMTDSIAEQTVAEPVIDEKPAEETLPLTVKDSVPAVMDTMQVDSIAQDSALSVSLRIETPRLTENYLPDGAFVMQPSVHGDTVTIWITDSAYLMQDTISMVMTYWMSDSVYNLVPMTDTIKAIYRAPRISDKAKASMAKNQKKPVLDVKSNAGNTFEVYNELILSCATPLSTWEKDSMHLYEMEDTIRHAVPFSIKPVESGDMQIRIAYNWKPEASYVWEMDSAALHDIYGVASNTMTAKLKIRSLEEYSTLIIKIEPYAPGMMIQLLSEKDKPVRTARAAEDGVKFEYLKPESYYVRIYEDLNGDSVWTTGDWAKKIQPEPVYYFPKKLTLRANWDFEETVEYLKMDILEQKPQELKKDNSKKK